MSKNNKSTPNASSKKPTTAPSTKKLTPAQKIRLNKLLAKMPPVEKLDPKMYAKLQTTIRDTLAKTLPEYQQWVAASLIAADDCPTPLCSSCGNDCPTPNRKMDDMVVSAVNEAMTGAIRQALKDQFE